MNSLPKLSSHDFAAFFRDVHGYEPFPWQERLAGRVSQAGWPNVLDLPTGTGKTAALDVAVFALALQADLVARTAALRIVYVVDRRTIVDQAHERASKIAKALVDAKSDVVARVRDRLVRYSHNGDPLRTALLRGGIARDDDWARTPDQPLIAVSTVDQAGSRLLFRGYGVTDSMKPVHAGLLGNDVLYLLDEVHLSQPFRETLTAIRDRYRGWAERLLPKAFDVVEMSATPGSPRPGTFGLEESDRRHAVLSTRLRASKPVSLVSVSAKGFEKEIEKSVISMLDRPRATVAVVVNRVNAARDVHTRLCQSVSGGSSVVHLLTGRMRPFDRDALDRSLFPRIRAGRAVGADDQPVVVVATQSIEAGADFDFDGIVTECASLDALRQRFGRLDRLGALSGSARGVIVARTDTLKDDAVYGQAIGRTWEWLRAHAAQHPLDFGIEALTVPADAEECGLLAPREHAPVLLPSHLDAWVQTAPMPDADPDVALWLHGPQRGLADVQVVWRADLTEALVNQAAESGDAGMQAADIAIGMVEVLPPVSAEAMSVPFLAARRWLEGGFEPESHDVEGSQIADDDLRDERLPGPSRPVIIWQGEHSRIVRARQIAPGQTIVVPSTYGGVEHGNWAPASRVPVTDVAEAAAWRQGRRPMLRLHQAVVRTLLGPDTEAPRPDSSDSEALDDRSVVLAWLDGLNVVSVEKPVRELIERLRSESKSLRIERLSVAPGDTADEYFVVSGRRRPVPVETEAITVDDCVTTGDARSSFTGAAVTLPDHLDGVREMVSGFGRRMGVPDEVAADLRRAAEWHDAGKADSRFQRWLHGGSEFKALVQAVPLAKGTARLTSRKAMRVSRERSEYPAGGRHELMSLALMESAGHSLSENSGDRDLVRHLVASHHGYCRPLAPWVPDLKPVDVVFTMNGLTCRASSSHDLARLDSGIADRFWQNVRRYGWWGLAWIEAVLRLADHSQSEREQLGGKSR